MRTWGLAVAVGCAAMDGDAGSDDDAATDAPEPDALAAFLDAHGLLAGFAVDADGEAFPPAFEDAPCVPDPAVWGDAPWRTLLGEGAARVGFGDRLDAVAVPFVDAAIARSPGLGPAELWTSGAVDLPGLPLVPLAGRYLAAVGGQIDPTRPVARAALAPEGRPVPGLFVGFGIADLAAPPDETPRTEGTVRGDVWQLDAYVAIGEDGAVTDAVFEGGSLPSFLGLTLLDDAGGGCRLALGRP